MNYATHHELTLFLRRQTLYRAVHWSLELALAMYQPIFFNPDEVLMYFLCVVVISSANMVDEQFPHLNAN